MNKLIKSKQRELTALCKKFHVEELEVFGSVTRDDFSQGSDAGPSDLDFLVEFNQAGLVNYADNYFGLLSALQALFSHPIDLIVASSVSNPYFLQSIEQDRTSLYAA